VEDRRVSVYGAADQRDEVAERHPLGSRRVEYYVGARAGGLDADPCEVVDVYRL
jgi:hypothetical protein